MPEGDTIHRLADRVAPVLAGHPLVRFRAPRLVGPVRPRVGMVVHEVGAHGKHLLVRFERGLTLDVHLGMVGTWQIARPGERWRAPEHLLRLLLGVDGHDVVVFRAPTVRAWVADDLRRSPLAHLGPDLAEVRPDLDVAFARMRTFPDPSTSIADVLLDQRVACGVGNVFKSEVLWACGVDPFSPVAAVDDPTCRHLLATAAAQLRANLGVGRRTTVPGGLAVYGRAGRRCRRCGTQVRARRHGEQARVTYWCPSCQRPTAARPS